MRIDVERHDGVAVLHAPGDVIHAEVGVLLRTLESCVEQGCHVVLDLRQSQFLSSLALHAIADQLDALRARGCDMRLCCVSEHVTKLLEVAGLADRLQLCDDVDAAIATLGKGVGAVERFMLGQRNG